MKKFIYLVGVAVCMASVALDGQIKSIFDLFTLAVVLAPAVGVAVATGSIKTLYRGFRAVIVPNEDITEEARGQAASLFRLMSKTTAISAVLFTLISLNNMLHTLDFSYPNAINSLGSNIAASLGAPVMGLLIIFAVFEPAVFILKKRSPAKK